MGGPGAIDGGGTGAGNGGDPHRVPIEPVGGPPRPRGGGGKAVVVLAAVLALACIGGGAYIMWVQRTGELTEATVTDCQRHRRSTTCTGTWVEGGSLLEGGHVEIGTIEGATSDDVGETIDVRVDGGRAYTLSSRLPAVLIGVGLVVVALGAYQLHATRP